MVVILFPLKATATIVLFFLKTLFNLLSYIVLGCSLPFVLLSEWLGSLIGVLSGLCLIAMLFAWRFGDLEGKYVIGCTAILGLLSALFFAAEEIATAIQCKLDSVSDFFGDLISDIWE